MSRRRILDDSQAAIARALYETEGLSLDKIAERFSCSASTITSELRKLGVAIKKQGRPVVKPAAPEVTSGTTQPANFEVTRSW